MARVSTVKNRDVIGNGPKSQETKISLFLGMGMTNAGVLNALTEFKPEIIEPDDERRNPQSKRYVKDLPDFDPLVRQRTMEAIRSTRKQDGDKDEEIDNIMRVAPRGGVKPLNESKLENLERFDCGVQAINYIYGTSKFVHMTDDAPDGIYAGGKVHPRWYRGDPMIQRADGNYEVTREDSGQTELVVLKRGEEPVKRRRYDLIKSLDRVNQITQHGMPRSFLSIWGGSAGVGKSRLAVSVCKSLNGNQRRIAELTGTKPRPILYLNGEAAEAQFTQWAGNVDPELFLASHDEIVRLDDVVNDIYEYQPELVIVDSLQMMAEVKKSPTRGAELVMSRLKALKVDPDAGLPHIVFISQLNKKEELAGAQYLAHMVDFVARATRYEGRKGTFLFECPQKNRGGETPRGAIFRHQDFGLECLSTDTRSASNFKLVQPVAPVVVSALANNQAPTHTAVSGAI
jgi:hypothetical protein